jgi:Protein of unknown function (DUF3107)
MANKKSSATARTDIRIGISDSSQELHIESELESEKAIAIVTAAIDSGKPLALTDVRGRQTIIPNGKISFVEVGEISERRVGFATA